MIRVVIADDQQLVRGGFSLILKSAADIEVVAEAGYDGEYGVIKVFAPGELARLG